MLILYFIEDLWPLSSFPSSDIIQGWRDEFEANLDRIASYDDELDKKVDAYQAALDRYRTMKGSWPTQGTPSDYGVGIAIQNLYTTQDHILSLLVRNTSLEIALYRFADSSRSTVWSRFSTFARRHDRFQNDLKARQTVLRNEGLVSTANGLDFEINGREWLASEAFWDVVWWVGFLE